MGSNSLYQPIQVRPWEKQFSSVPRKEWNPRYLHASNSMNSLCDSWGSTKGGNAWKGGGASMEVVRKEEKDSTKFSPALTWNDFVVLA